MRRQTPIAHQLYAYLYPHPTPNDPPNFSAHLARNLVPEVRIEVATFYGDLNSAEARYPGLNYCYPPHRMRLGRFKHHRRLFEAFDSIGLTYNEVQDFCCWEGTRWARERYEKDEGVKVVDTTGDEIRPYVDRRELRAAEESRRKSITRQTDISVIVEEAPSPAPTTPSTNAEVTVQLDTDIDSPMANCPPADAFAVPAIRPITISRTSHAADTARRREDAVNRNIIAAWEQGYSLPPELEQWLKEQSERGTLGMAIDLRHFTGRRDSRSYSRRTHRATSATMTPRAAA